MYLVSPALIFASLQFIFGPTRLGLHAFKACEAPRGVQYDLINQSINQKRITIKIDTEPAKTYPEKVSLEQRLTFMQIRGNPPIPLKGF